MIAHITGILEAILPGSAVQLRLALGPDAAVSCEVHVSAYTAARLGGSFDQRIALHTLHFIESTNQGAMLTPRLAGFLSVEDRRFFELFTTCKGIGPRKALRALALRTDMVAAAIVDRDLATLQSLPEIGKRTAETIVATLHGKVEPFLTLSSLHAQHDGAPADADAGSDAPSSRKKKTSSKKTAADGDGAATAGAAEAGPGQAGQVDQPMAAHSLARQSLEALLLLGENRIQAMQWIDQALRADPPPRDPAALIEAVYAIKVGGG